MFWGNTWLWFHVFAGGAAARLFLIGFEPMECIEAVVSLAILYEVAEFMFAPIEEVYGSTERFLFDALGDVVGAGAMAGVVVF